ncbi:hypothetical protein [Brevibacillus porteri]|uniref:hypothetical protein n=1 Tax=Brevibacillus porteri TaxID=2126350 RepID=UPI003637440D
MQKAKHALKRPPLKNILKELLWTRFRFLHEGGQSIPQRVGQEAERFLLFPPHHNSQKKALYRLHKVQLGIAEHAYFWHDNEKK